MFNAYCKKVISVKCHMPTATCNMLTAKCFMQDCKMKMLGLLVGQIKATGPWRHDGATTGFAIDGHSDTPNELKNLTSAG